MLSFQPGGRLALPCASAKQRAVSLLQRVVGGLGVLVDVHAPPGALGRAVRLAALPAGGRVAPPEEEVPDHRRMVGEDLLAQPDVARLLLRGMPLAPGVLPVLVVADLLVVEVLALQVCVLLPPLQGGESPFGKFRYYRVYLR